MPVLKISIYLAALVAANFIVFEYGKTGLIFTAIFLIPFDFVLRAWFHESWKGKQLFARMCVLIATAGVVTYAFNPDTKTIALASMGAFILAQASASIFYQAFIKRGLFLKVNGSDLVGIAIDSLIFQELAFGAIDFQISLSQTLLKFVGGLFWFWVIFKRLKLHERW